jgi:hypothetical protein
MEIISEANKETIENIKDIAKTLKRKQKLVGLIFLSAMAISNPSYDDAINQQYKKFIGGANGRNVCIFARNNRDELKSIPKLECYYKVDQLLQNPGRAKEIIKRNSSRKNLIFMSFVTINDFEFMEDLVSVANEEVKIYGNYESVAQEYQRNYPKDFCTNCVGSGSVIVGESQPIFGILGWVVGGYDGGRTKYAQ